MIAAERAEFAGLLRRMTCVRRLRSAPVDYLSLGTLRGVPALLAADGPGPVRARAALAAAEPLAVARVVVSTGLAGGLDPALKAREVFVAREVIGVDPAQRYPALKPAAKWRYAEGILYSADRVAGTADEKSRLRQTGAAAVDMEAAEVARYAASRKVPFYAIRAISDTAIESFSSDLNAMRDEAGRFRKGRIAASALLRPWAGIPELARLWSRSRAAAESLGAFLADCEF